MGLQRPCCLWRCLHRLASISRGVIGGSAANPTAPLASKLGAEQARHDWPLPSEVRHTMARRDPETNPAAFLGDELRRARLAAGFSSQDALAATLGFDRTVITKAETGERPPTVDVLAAWCQACRLPEELFTRLAGLARRADGPVPSWFEGWLEAEGKAHTLRLWSPVLLPGLLQTA